MFEKLKARYQQFLDDTDRADRYFQAPLELDSAGVNQNTPPPALPKSKLGRPDPYAQLAPESLNREWETMGSARQVVARAVETVRGYEAEASEWLKARLEEFDGQTLRARIEMGRFVDRVHGRPVPRHDWETPQYRRRHERNLGSVQNDLRDLLDGEDTGAVARRMLARADRASAAEVTGMIPTVSGAMEEEAWA